MTIREDFRSFLVLATIAAGLPAVMLFGELIVG
jgi:hypothetical protein